MTTWKLLSLTYKLQFDYPKGGWGDASKIVLESRNLAFSYDSYSDAEGDLAHVEDKHRFRIVRIKRKVAEPQEGDGNPGWPRKRKT